MTKRTPLEDRIAAMVQDVVDDVRTKVVETPWFGQPVTEKLADIHGALDHAQAQGKEQELASPYGRDQPSGPEPSLGPDRDYGIDR